MDYDEQALEAVRVGRLLIDRYDAWLFGEFSPYLGQRVLEVGCGLGNQIRHLTGRDLVVGIDLASSSVERVQQDYKDYPNIHAYTYSITDPAVLALSENGFDSALSLNVLEHVEDDQLALQHIYQMLKPGGKLILVLPAHMALYGTMDTSIGHYRRYNREFLRARLEKAGFRVLKDKYVNTVGAMGWWFNGRVLKKTVPPSGQLKLFNVIVPVLKTAEQIIPPPFGITVLSISEKPA